MLATVALERGDPTRATELAATARRHGGDGAWLGVVEGRALIQLGRQDEARTIAAALAADPPEKVHLLDSVGVLLVRTGLHEAALALFETAAEKAPSSPAIAYNLATTRQFLGDMAGAAEAYRRVLGLDPTQDRARLALVQLEPPTPARLAEAAARFEAVADDADRALIVGHAAARLAEDMGDDAGAMVWLDRAKAGKRAAARYDRDRAKQLFAAAEDAAARLAEHAHIGMAEAGGVQPVFVTGMPRSGTTLIDRILSSHPAVASAGELADFSLLVKRAGRAPGPLALDPASLSAEIDFAAVGVAYRARTAPLGGGAPRLIDKMPFNLFLVPHILAALPDARIVMLRRDARDTVFANYRQLFATGYGYYDYAFDLEDTAHWVACFEALADRFRTAFAGPRYTEVWYEAMIGAQEAESRRLIAFLGLEWNAVCLDFHANTQAVTTASSVQVRQPIHAASVGRWRRYGDHADRVQSALAAAGWRADQ